MPRLYVNTREFVELAERPVNRALSNEIAIRQQCDWYLGILNLLPDPDEVLRKLGADITVYEEMLTDPHVGACLDSRKSGTKGRLWEIDRGKSKSRHGKVIEKIFQDLPIKRLINEILDAIWYGFTPIEVTWAYDGALLIPAKVQAKPPKWFAFDQDNNLLLKTRDNPNGQPVPPYKFLVAQHNPRYTNPYGDRIASRCFWYHRFAKNGLKWWVMFTEKYGMPWILGKTPRGTPKAENDALLATLEKMVHDAIGVVPDDSSVEAVDSMSKAVSSQIYEKLLAYCNASISKALLGHSAGADSTPGKLGNEDMAMEARRDLIDSDSDLCAEVFNQLIDWIVELNFGEADRPRMTIYEEEDVDDALAKRDKVLSDTGVKFSKEYFIRSYGFEEADIEVSDPGQQALAQPGQPGQPRIELAEPRARLRSLSGVEKEDQADVDELLASISPAELQERMERMLAPVIELIESSAGYDDVLAKVIDLFPKLNDQEIERNLATAMSLAATRGRLSTQPVKRTGG